MRQRLGSIARPPPALPALPRRAVPASQLSAPWLPRSHAPARAPPSAPTFTTARYSCCPPGVLRTSDPCDLSAADVVLVITARGNDAHDAACFAAPGQQWGDDTHPEMGSAVLRELRARGAEVHKVRARPRVRLVCPNSQAAEWAVRGSVCTV